MKVLIVEPRQTPRRADIPHTLRDMQQTVGGYIEIIRPFDDPVVLVCDEEGKLKGMPLNIKATMLSGIHRHGDCIVGDAVVCSHNGNSDTVGLTQSQENALRAILAAIDASVPKSA